MNCIYPALTRRSPIEVKGISILKEYFLHGDFSKSKLFISQKKRKTLKILCIIIQRVICSYCFPFIIQFSLNINFVVQNIMAGNFQNVNLKMNQLLSTFNYLYIYNRENNVCCFFNIISKISTIICNEITIVLIIRENQAKVQIKT